MNEVQKIMVELEKQKSCSGDEAQKYSELQDMIQQIDFSVIGDTSPAEKRLGSKRRKMSDAEKKKEIETMLKKDLQDTVEQIDLVKKTLLHIYDMENTNFKETVSKLGKRTRKIMNKRSLIERIIANGEAAPLWIGRPDEQPPPLCGGIEVNMDYVAKVGELVCALLGKDTKDWSLAEVVTYDSKTEKYTVDDIYEDNKTEQIVDRNDVIFLPKFKANPETNPEALYPVQSLVLALCPQTTCFYRAIITKQPQTPKDPYMVMFEDSRYECNYVPPVPLEQSHILQYRSNVNMVNMNF